MCPPKSTTTRCSTSPERRWKHPPTALCVQMDQLLVHLQYGDRKKGTRWQNGQRMPAARDEQPNATNKPLKTADCKS